MHARANQNGKKGEPDNAPKQDYYGFRAFKKEKHGAPDNRAKQDEKGNEQDKLDAVFYKGRNERECAQDARIGDCNRNGAFKKRFPFVRF
jgi:hypothetical protein